MKKFLSLIACGLIIPFAAAAQESAKLTVSAGFLFPSTLNATVGYEHPLPYGHAVELYGEIGDHWQKPTSERFWNFSASREQSQACLNSAEAKPEVAEGKGYYWDGGLVYKHRLIRYKNATLRFRFGPQFGAVQRDFFIGVEGSFEYSRVFRNGWEFTLTQKNNVGFLHGDTFRNGLMIGFKAPL